MKKIILVLSLCLVCVCGCSSNDKSNTNEDGMDELLKAFDKYENSEGFSGDFDMSMEMSMSKESAAVEEKMSGTIIKNGKGEDFTKAEMKMDLTMQISGQTEQIVAYFKDGYMYMDYKGVRMKQAIDSNTDTSISGQGSIKTLSKKEIDKTSMSEKNGKKIIKATIKKKYLEKIVEEEIGSQYSELGDDLKFKNYKFVCTLNKDGEMEKEEVSFEMNMTILEQKVSVKVSFTANIDDYGKQKIDFPDFNEYKDMNELENQTSE